MNKKTAKRQLDNTPVVGSVWSRPLPQGWREHAMRVELSIKRLKEMVGRCHGVAGAVVSHDDPVTVRHSLSIVAGTVKTIKRVLDESEQMVTDLYAMMMPGPSDAA